MVTGKNLVLYEVYTFYKRYEKKKHDEKWQSFSLPRCPLEHPRMYVILYITLKLNNT